MYDVSYGFTSCAILALSATSKHQSVQVSNRSLSLTIPCLLRTGPLQTFPNHHAIVPGAGINGVWVEPVPELITGELKTWAYVSSVSSIRIPGYWLHKRQSKIDIAASPIPGEKVVYALHGGGYIRLSAHPSDVTAGIARELLKHIPSVYRVFSVEYRLSMGRPYVPTHPFPAALLDALAGYNYLVNVVGFSPSDVIIEGDSAGGNLAHALTRYLIEYQTIPDINLPAPPGALLLLSPWADLGQSHDTPGSSSLTFLHSDYIGVVKSQGTDYAKAAFLGPHGMGAAEINRYISPASLNQNMKVDFKGFPRTFIVCGGAEVLRDQIRTFKDKMICDLEEGNGLKDGDGKVRYYEAKDGVHDYLVFPWHEPERGDTLREIARWVSVE